MAKNNKAPEPQVDRKVDCPVHGKQRAEDRSGKCEPCIYGRNIQPPVVKNHGEEK